MKNKFFLFVVLLTVVATVSLKAQYDTVYNRCPRYYYTNSEWYDSCYNYYHSYPETYYILYDANASGGPSGDLIANYHFADEPMEIIGMMGMVHMEPIDPPANIQSLDRIEEYFVLIEYDEATGAMVILDSLRWDTITPKVLKLPRCHDTAQCGFMYCYAYEAYFNKPVTVDSVFYVAGTQRNNGFGWNEDSTRWGQYHPATIYRTVFNWGIDWRNGDDQCYAAHQELELDSYTGNWDEMGDAGFTTFFPIVDKASITVLSNDSMMGSVTGSGWYPRGHYATITATPVEGFYFKGWSDGSRDSVRTFRVFHDDTLTARFGLLDTFLVSAAVNDTAWGRVEGTGRYEESSQATLTAVPADSCVFTTWMDGVRDNPRTITVTQDTLLRAVFYSTVGIDNVQENLLLISPNPADAELLLTVTQAGKYRLQVFDMQGRRLIRQQLDATDQASFRLDIGSMPPGTYVLRLEGKNASAVKPFVKQ